MYEALNATSTLLPVWRWVEKLKGHILNSRCFCTILVFLFTFIHAGSLCSRWLSLQGPAWSTNPLSEHVLCGAQGTNPSRLSGTAFTLPCCAHLGEGTSNSFTPFMPLAWKLLVPGHDAPRLGTLSLQDSLTYAVQTTWRQGRRVHQAESTERCAKQGLPNGGLQETCGTALGDRFYPLSRFEGDMNPALRICCPYLPLPLEVTSQNLYSKPRQGELAGHSEWKGCLTNPFPVECKSFSEGI